MNFAEPAFLYFIRHLRGQEEIVLHTRFASIAAADEEQARQFLHREYHHERPEYPGTPPEFDSPAALWAARTVFIAAQLLLLREQEKKDVIAMLPDFDGVINEGAILSADICLRFLPDILSQAHAIDTNDPLIALLEKQLHRWHYSAIGYSFEISALDFDLVFSSTCLQQLYKNRVVERKAKRWAEHPALHAAIRADLGDYAHVFWKEL